jgi:hypothetical protein
MSIKLNYKNLFPYLTNTAICTEEDLDYIKIDARASKTFNWVIELLPNRGKLVVKHVPHEGVLYNDDRVRKEWYIYNFLQSNEYRDKALDYVSLLTPQILHFDESNSILAYKVPHNYITLESYYENHKTFPTAIAELVGTTLAKLHSKTMNSQDCYTSMTEFEEDKLNYQLPYPDYPILEIYWYFSTI